MEALGNGPRVYLKRHHLLQAVLTVSRLDLGLFLAMLEVSIVSTALVPITNDLQILGQSSWVVISYLVTYSGMLPEIQSAPRMYS